MNFRRKRMHDEPEINLIPFIDVLLVILIFLMVTTTYSKYTELQITLPTAEGEKMLERARELNVVVDARGRYVLNGEAIVFENPVQFAAVLRQAANALGDGSDPVLIISADNRTAHQQVIQVMEAARIAGLARLTFATQSGAGS